MNEQLKRIKVDTEEIMKTLSTVYKMTCSECGNSFPEVDIVITSGIEPCFCDKCGGIYLPEPYFGKDLLFVSHLLSYAKNKEVSHE